MIPSAPEDFLNLFAALISNQSHSAMRKLEESALIFSQNLQIPQRDGSIDTIPHLVTM